MIVERLSPQKKQKRKTTVKNMIEKKQKAVCADGRYTGLGEEGTGGREGGWTKKRRTVPLKENSPRNMEGRSPPLSRLDPYSKGIHDRRREGQSEQICSL